MLGGLFLLRSSGFSHFAVSVRVCFNFVNRDYFDIVFKALSFPISKNIKQILLPIKNYISMGLGFRVRVRV